jgi:hypothetical protein
MTTIDAFPEVAVDPNIDCDKRYTTRETMDLCMRMAGVGYWDLDVAADEESHWADRWFGVEQDGLIQRWDAPVVWCNPPYSDIQPWLVRAWHAMQFNEGAEVIAMLLPANRTEQPWWFSWVERRRDGRGEVCDLSGQRVTLTTHFLPTRVKFGHPGNRDAVGVGSPPFGCVLLCWRRS